MSLLKKILPSLLIFLSSIIGLRIFNLFLIFDNRSEGNYIHSVREFDSCKKLRVAHPPNYEIFKPNMKQIIILSDSIGEGIHCGNQKNLAGLLAKEKEINVVNLSARGTSPPFYFNQLKKYNSMIKSSKFNSIKNTFLFIIYSNDIVLDKEYCKFYRSLENSKKDFSYIEISYLNQACFELESMDKFQYRRRRNIRNHPVAKIIQFFIGEYSFLFFRELISQLIVLSNFNSDIGRLGFVRKWDIDQAEAKLLRLVIKKSYDFCKKNNCNIEYFIFPNVENITKDSLFRKPMISFSSHIKKRYGINIHDGYEPFIEKGIIKANHSFTDNHPSCYGYSVYADWLSKLIIK